MGANSTSFKPGESGNIKDRPKGSKNYKTLLIDAKLEEHGFDPIKAMIDIAKDENVEVAIRGRMAAELAGYQHAKRTAVEVTGDLGNKTTDDYTNEELQAFLQGQASDESPPSQAVRRPALSILC